MKTTFSCRCGQRLQARDENRGKRVRCPSCNAVVRVPEADESGVDVYALAATTDGIAAGVETTVPGRLMALARDAPPSDLLQATADAISRDVAEPAAGTASNEDIQAARVNSLSAQSSDAGGPSSVYAPPPLPGESRPERAPSRRDVGDSRIGRLASRALFVVGWLCITVAGLQFSVFAGSCAWSFKVGRDVAAHEAKIHQVEQEISALDDKIMKKLAPPPARRAFAVEDVPQDRAPAHRVIPGAVDPDEAARERLHEEFLRLRISKPSEFTMTAAFAMATGFAGLLFWLAATSGLLSGTAGCLLLRLAAR